MNNESRKNGFTLVELLVAAAIIAMLVAIAIPSARALHSSYESTGTQSMINSALSTARAIAAKNQRYAGVRFQKAWQLDNDGPQYMIFIMQDFTATGLVNGFCAVPGLKPVKLPANMGVMDLKYNLDKDLSGWVNLNGDWKTVILPSAEFCDTTTFSIVFSPTGKMIVHNVRVRNKDGERGTSILSHDEIFNTENNVTALNPIGMFIQDDYSYTTPFSVAGSNFWVGLQEESGRSYFVIFDKERLKNAQNRWLDYLGKTDSLGNYIVPRIYINPYTGTMIEK